MSKSIRATLLEHALVCERCRIVLERLLLDEGTVKHALDEGVFPPMRTQLDLQRAHDLLGEVLRSKQLCDEIFPDPVRRTQVKTGLACLCWCLGHTHTNDRMGENFGRLLIQLESVLREGGYVLREIVEEPPRKAPQPKRKPERKPPEPAFLQKDPDPMEFEFGNED